MKKAKRLLSVILAILMLYSGMSVGMTALAMSVNVNGTSYTSTDDAIISVPETVYLTPTGGAATAGQYYVNNTLSADGKITTDAVSDSASANIYFYIPGATDFSMEVSTVESGYGDIVVSYNSAYGGVGSGLVFDANQNIGASYGAAYGPNSNGYMAIVDILGLYISGTGVNPGNSITAEWKFTVTMNDGSTRVYYAYSVLYSPHRSVGAVSESRRSGTYNNEISAWITGINGIGGSGNWSPISSGSGDKTTQGIFKYDPLWTGLQGGSSESSDDYVTASTTEYYVEAKAPDGSDWTRAIGYLGYITVDSSRYTNTTQIPNFKIGSDALRVQESKKDSLGKYYSWYVFGDSSKTIGTDEDDTPSGWTQWVSKSEPQSTSRDTMVPSYSISSINGLYIHVASQGYCTYLSSKNYANAYVSAQFKTVDKSSLRQLVLQGTSLNKNNYTSASWEAYQTALRNAALALGNPSNSTIDTSTLTSKRDALQTTVTLNANGGSIGTTSFNQTVGAAASYSYNLSSYVPTRAGYTFKGWSTSSTATSGATTVSAGLKPTFYAVWEINKYTVTFDNLLNFSAWNTTSASNGTISNVTSDGFTLTSNSGVGEGTSTSPLFPVTAGKQYKVDMDIEGDAWDVYIFFYDNNTSSGTGIEFVDGAARRFSSSGVNPERTFTAPTGATRAVIRVDANGASNTVRFSNIRIFEVGKVGDGISYVNSQTVNYNSTLSSVPTPTRTGYTFSGWVYEDGTVFNNSDKITEDTVLYSKWIASKYTITYDNGGAVSSNDYYPSDSLTLPTLTKTGYTHTGWKVKTAAGNWSGTYTPGQVVTGMTGNVTLEAVWSVNSYTVTFDSNGGSSVASKDYTINDSFTFDVPARTGYTFSGWKVKESSGSWTKDAIVTTASGSYGNVTLVAQWTATKHTITFLDWNDVVLKESNEDYDSTPTPPANPERADDNWYTYEFSAWNPTIDKVTGTATYKATYKATLIPYTITLDAGEGSVSSDVISYNGETTSVTLPDAQRTGYTFLGWKVDTTVGSWTAGTTLKGELTLDKAYGNVNLTATYSANNYTVYYDANGGELKDPTDDKFVATYNLAVPPLNQNLTRTGYTFAGWNTKADGSGDNIVVGETIWTYTDVTTLYAQWTAVEYTVNFMMFDKTNGKVGFTTAPEALTYTVEDDLSAIMPHPEVEGYNFVNYIVYSSPNNTWGTNAEYALSELSAGKYGNVTLAIVYTAKEYTVTFMNDDGSVLDTQTVVHGKTPVYNGTPSKAPTAEYSYEFAGWSPAVVPATEDAVYTATYNQKDREYTVRFVDDMGGVISEKAYKYGATVEVPADPAKESTAEFNYTFTYWKDAQGNKVDTVPDVTADVTYTADFTATTREYAITWIVDGVTTTATVKYGEMPVYNNGVNPSKAPTAEFTYTFEGWSPAIATVTGEATYTAQFSSTTNSYTVTFVNWDGTELDTQTLEYGETPVYAGETPERATDAQYIYTFSGWDPEIDEVTGDVTYTALYSTELRKYVITFVDEDGSTVLQSGEWEYGSTPVFSATAPSKAATAKYTYTFDGWTEAIAEVTGEATYTAKYKATINKYTITFVDEDGTTVLKSEEVEYDAMPVAPVDPVKAGTAQYSYTFEGWTPEVVTVTEDATYKATYTQSVNKYTVKFVNWNDELIQSAEVEYGTVPAQPETNPERPADVQYTYTFAGWDSTVVAVTGDVTYKATYTGTLNQYTVTFTNWDGTVLQSGKLDYGATPTAPADPSRPSTDEFDYTFAGWTPVISTVSGNVTYIADYTAIRRSYTVTFVDYDGTLIKTDSVEYGAMPTAPADPSREATAQYTYKFAGWSPAVETVKGTATYTATYNETVNKYTVTFYDENGTTVLDTQTLDYGSALVYGGTTPEKAPIEGVEYAFSGWSATLGSEDVIALPNVTGHASYYAVYIATNIELDVTIIEEDGTSATTKVKYGTYASELTFDNNQSKEQDAQYTYTFIGWNVIADSETALDLATYKITANTTFYPAYEKTVREYVITFYNEDGETVLESMSVPYGTVPAAAVPAKAATAQYTYTFAGWTPDVVAVTGTASYKATFDASINSYTVTFVDYDGHTLKTETVEYGKKPTAPADPTRPADVQYTYMFAGWDDEIVDVTEDATYTATYSKTTNKYLVRFVNENGDVLQQSEIEYGQTPVYTGTTPVKTGDAQYSYTFKEWSPAITSVAGVATYTATYTQSVNEYTITFVNEDGTVLQQSDWEYGATPVYTGATPTKAATAQYTYTFRDWGTIAEVTADATYTASYNATVNKYVITFVNEDGTELQKSEWEYGATPTYTGATPTKAATAQYTYTFKDWGAIAEVTADATYTATYTATVNNYTVKFVNDDGDVLQEEVLPYGEMPEYKGATPAKSATPKYTYTFKSWDAEIVTVTDNVTYTATYTYEINKYTISFVNEDGTVLQSTQVEYDATPAYTGNTPEKEADVQYTYTFKDWSPAVVSVTGDATYTATYTATVNTYTITWVTGTDTYTGVWEYGAMPDPATDSVDTSKASTVSTDYSFKSWDAEIVTVTGDATYTAVYTETTRKYTITWIVNGVETTADVEYGNLPVFDGTPTKASTAQYDYVFTNWTPEVVEVEGNATYEAEFEAKIRSYTITWVTGAGEFTGIWEYGAMPDPAVDNVDTSKPSVPEYDYTFTSWNKEIVSVTGDATYTAQYSQEIRSYKVTYVVNGEVLEEQTVKFGFSFSHPAIPAVEGYEAHWDVAFMTMPAEDITVNAVYTAKKYTVIWVADGETVYTEQVEFKTALPNKPVPAKVGHSGVWDIIPETMPAGDVIITAVYTPNNYTVSWNFSYGSGTGVATYGVDYEVTFKLAILPIYLRVTVGGVEISDEYFTYDNTTGTLFIVGEAISGHISISERAAEGYQNVIISVSNAVLSNNSSIVEEGQAYHTQILPADGYLLPEFVTVYVNGVEIYDGYSYDANTGRLTINAEVMTGELTISVECPVDPDYDPNATDCDCNCHGNAFVKFFFKIITFLRKLFGMSQYQYCDCGVAHW